MARSIRTNVIISYVLLALLFISVIGFLSIGFTDLIGTTTYDQSSDALQTQIRTNLQSQSGQIASIINQKFDNAESMVLMMANELEHILNGSRYGSRDVYYDWFFEYNRSAGLVPSDTYYDASYQVWLSWSYASYYFPGSNHNNYLQRSAELNQTIESVASMDYIFQTIHVNAPDFRWLYIAFAGSNLFINYPGSVVGGTFAERMSDPYYPTTQPWYQEVILGQGDIVFTEPYFDEIDGVPLITIGRAVYYPNGTLMGTICGDISIQDIVDKILDFQILDTGYASLITSTSLVIAHPEFIPTDPTEPLPLLNEVEINFGGSSALSSSQITELTSGESGILSYTRDGQHRYLAYTPVEKGDYICLVIVPEAEAVASVAPLQSRMANAAFTTTLQVIILMVITLAASIAIGSLIAFYIVKPISRLTDLAVSLSTDKARKDILAGVELDPELLSKKDEIGQLTRAFASMVESVREEETERIKGENRCPKCASPVSPKWRSCVYCGASLDETTEWGVTDTEKVQHFIAQGQWNEAARVGAAAVDPLLQVLQEGDIESRRGATDALGQVGDAGIEPLIVALKDEDSYVRWRAAVSLGRIGDPRATSALIRALKDEDGLVRGGAAWALGEIGSSKGLRPLQQAAKKEDEPTVKESIDEAIAKLTPRRKRRK
ncbi:MAG: HEAT repeat domain-containing protein [Candidatus Thorarchaeota archaeon]